MKHKYVMSAFIFIFAILSLSAQEKYPVDSEVVAKIREEGFQRSQIANTLSYMTDVIGARLTNSDAMVDAQNWAISEMKKMGLKNTAKEPFMDYGVSWDNEYFSMHLTKPDYQPMLGYPIAHTPGIKGKQTLSVVLAPIKTKDDLKKYKGKLRGKAVLSSPMPKVDLNRYQNGRPRYSEDELRDIASNPFPDPPRPPRGPANPNIVSAVDKNIFYKEEGVAAVLESRSGWIAAVRGFARPGAKIDVYDRNATLNHLPVVAVTPEHYNRMYRILERNIPVEIDLEIRTKVGNKRRQAKNVVGEIPGTDLKDEIVMLGAHFDTWHASPNASDNSSGVAVMLEAMRILKSINVKPRRTIRVALWSGEEQGLHGSREYVYKHFGDPNDPKIGKKKDYDKLSAYFNQDYGPGQFKGIFLQENEHVREIFKSWMEPFEDLGMTTIGFQKKCCTDHVPFDRVGLPAFQFLQDRVGGTGGHTNLDFYDTIPIEDVKKNAVIIASFVYHTAMLDERLPRKKR